MFLLLLFLSIIPNTSFAGHKEIFLKEGFKWVKRAECGKCKNICHYDKHDRGGFTCIGISMVNNIEFYKYYIDLTYGHYDIAKYSSKYRFLPIPVRMYDKHDKNLPAYIFASYYWDKYVKKYENCRFPVLMHLADTSILSGRISAIKILQRTMGLKVDGKWGKQSEKACQDKKLDIANYVKNRKKYLSRLTQYKRYGKGWNKRINQLHKIYK